jgi:hypothetical protein
MGLLLIKGTGNQIRNRNKAIEIALKIYDGAYKTDDNNSNVCIGENLYRVAAYANPKAKSALVDEPQVGKRSNAPVWYAEKMSGVILVRQASDGRLMFFAIDKEMLYQSLKTGAQDSVSVDWDTGSPPWPCTASTSVWMMENPRFTGIP